MELPGSKAQLAFPFVAFCKEPGKIKFEKRQETQCGQWLCHLCLCPGLCPHLYHLRGNGAYRPVSLSGNWWTYGIKREHQHPREIQIWMMLSDALCIRSVRSESSFWMFSSKGSRSSSTNLFFQRQGLKNDDRKVGFMLKDDHINYAITFRA